MSEVKIAAEPRTEFGKGGARRTRRAGKVPAVLYGHGGDPVHLSLPAREISRALRTEGGNVLLSLDIQGEAQLALAKSVQRNALRGDLEHIDLVRVSKGEKVVVDLPVHLVGEAAPDTIVMQDSMTISVEAEARHLPESVDLSIAGMSGGQQITAGEVKLPQGTTLAGNPDTVVVAVMGAPSEAEVEADLAAAEEDLGAGAIGAAAKAEEEAAEEADADPGAARDSDGDGHDAGQDGTATDRGESASGATDSGKGDIVQETSGVGSSGTAGGDKG